MDPNRAWHELRLAYAEKDWDMVLELALALVEWMETKQGFPPRTFPQSSRLNESDVAWDRFVAMAVARAACGEAIRDRSDIPF